MGIFVICVLRGKRVKSTDICIPDTPCRVHFFTKLSFCVVVKIESVYYNFVIRIQTSFKIFSDERNYENE